MCSHFTRIVSAGINNGHCFGIIRRNVLAHNSVAKRGILSESFTDSVGSMFQIPESDNQQLSTICLQIDRCSEKGQPFSSIAIDRMVNAVEDSDDIKTTMYYLHKFRHSKTCYFLRPWTVHVWIKKCIAWNEMDYALEALKNNSQYAIFPDEMAFNLLLNHCLNSKQYEKAFAFLSHMFKTEMMQSSLSHIIALVTLLRFIDGPLTMQKLNEQLPIVEEKRNFGGILYRLGQALGDRSLHVMGLAVLGSVEREHGIRAVYQEPWAPLIWEEGYLQKALSLLQGLDLPVSQESLDLLQEVIDDDEELLLSYEKIITDLKDKNSISNSQNFSSVVDKQISNLESSEKVGSVEFQETASKWMSTNSEIRNLEKEILSEWKTEREEHIHKENIRKAARKMAVEKLGYWELLEDGKQEDKEIELHIREDYVEGSISDLHIERRRNTGELYFYDQHSQ